MSFLSSYSNVNATSTLTTANLSGSNINISDASRIVITGGLDGGVLAKGSGNNLTFVQSPVEPANSIGGNTLVLYKQGNSNSLVGSSNLTFNSDTNTLNVGGTFTTNANLQTTDTVNLGSVNNVRIAGGSANQVLISDGQGNVYWGSPTSSAVVPTYVSDPQITTFSFTYGPGTRQLTLSVNGSKLQYLAAGRRIAFVPPAPGITLYTIGRIISTSLLPAPVNTYAVQIELTQGLLQTVLIGTACTLFEAVPVNTVALNGALITSNVNDSVLTLSQTYGFTANGQILTNNNNANFAPTSNVRYYQTAEGNATANNQLVINQDLNVTNDVTALGNINVLPNNNNTTPSLNFVNSGILSAGGTGQVAITANTFQMGAIKPKAMPSKTIRYSMFEKNVGQNISSSVYPTNWTVVTWNRSIFNNSGLSWDGGGTFTNNTGVTVWVQVTYTMEWGGGMPRAGGSKAFALITNGQDTTQIVALSCNRSVANDTLIFNGSASVELAPGNYVQLKATQNTDVGSIPVGQPNKNAVGGRITLYVYT